MKVRFSGIAVFLSLCLWFSPTLSQREPIDTILQQFRFADHSRTKLEFLLDRIIPHYMQTAPDSALYYAERSLSIAETAASGAVSEDSVLFYRQLKSRTLRLLGNVWYATGQNEKAMENFHQALDISRELNDQDGVARAYVNIGNILYSEGHLSQALTFFEQAYETGDILGDLQIMAASSNNIGNVFRLQGNNIEALRQYHISFELREKMGDIAGMTNSLNNIGLVYKNENQFEKSIEYYLKSLSIAEQTDNRIGMALVLGNLSSLYISLAQEADLLQGNRAGEPYLRQAVSYGLKAMDAARSVNALPRVNAVAEHLMNAYQKLGQYRQALAYAQIYIETRDSLFNEEKSAIIAEMQVRFESEQRQQEIINQQLIIDKTKADYKRQRAQRNFLFAIALLLLLMVILIWMQFRQKTRVNKLINEKNAMLERAYEELQSANEELVTQQEIITENLEKKVAVAEQMLDFKQKFLAQMSHEIRTPLTGVLGITDALAGTKLTPQQKHFIDILRYSGESLIGIINDVLDYSRIEAGKLELKRNVFNIHDLMRSSLDLFFGTRHEEVILEFHPSANLPEFLEADELRLGQVIRNLLSNAVKFTEKGKIILDAVILPGGEDNQQATLRVSVTDTGPGISAAQVKELFKPFSQLKRNDLRPVEGTGLGLSICKEIVELHGGEIGVNSEPGKGSEFWFTAKVSIPGQKIPVEQNRFASKAVYDRNLKILLVDDKEVNRKVIKVLLSGMGHHVTIATNGQEAVNLYQPASFDLILMDIQMPVMDGIMATGILRERFKDLPPIVALSANAFEGDREKYLAEGMDEYLTKPFNVNAFLKVMEKFFLSSK